MPPLQIADIILTRGKGYFSNLIVRRTREGLEGAGYSHAALVLSNDARPLVLEARPPRVRCSLLSSLLLEATAAVHLSPLNLTLDDRLDIRDAALALEGRLYGYHRFIGFGLDAILKSDWASQTLGIGKEFPICSVLVAGAYALKGLDFGEPHHGVSPNEIDFFGRTHPHIYAMTELPCGPDLLVSA